MTVTDSLPSPSASINVSGEKLVPLSEHPLTTTKKMLNRYFKSVWTRKTLEQRLPIVTWLPKYNWNWLMSDFLAGLTVGLTAIPQGIAYAVVAGLEPQYGLYSGFMGCFVYLFLGSTKDITIGPTAIMALMTQKAVETYGSDLAVLLCFLSGCIILLLGVLHLGFLVTFISIPVVVGFTSASAITIACSQLKGLLGISGKSNEFLDTWIAVGEHISETRWQDLTLGLITIAALFSLKIGNDKIQMKYRNRTSQWVKFLLECLRILNLARNAIVVIVGTGLAYALSKSGESPFKLTGDITGGMPPFQPPPFSTVYNNQTVSFSEMVSALGANIISIPLIAILESIAIAKAFAKGKTLDATQEMIALGVSNIFGSFVRSIPTTGSFTRTAVNNASGVRTPLGGIFTGALVLAALSLTSTFYYIPKATLAAVIITAMFYMVEYHEIYIIWKAKKLDIVPLATTILGCLFWGLDYGMLLGIGTNLIYILYGAARPPVYEEKRKICEKEVLLVRPEQSLIYPSAEYVRERVMKFSEANEKGVTIVIDGQNMRSIDSTVAKNIKTLTRDLSIREQPLMFWNWNSNLTRSCLGVDSELNSYFKSGDSLEKLLVEK